MKNLLVKASILAVLCTMVGCADNDDAGKDKGCTESQCKDANTLAFCNNGVALDVPCELGCDMATNACKSAVPSCSSDMCLNANTLQKCNADGTTSEIPCANGCDFATAACKDASASCTISVCQDNSTLLACANGQQSKVECPYGCEAGACKSECKANYCKDGATLITCANGVETAQVCERGCDAGACKEACTANFCRDASNLMVCNADGSMSLTNCPYGCDAGACKTSAGACTDGAVQCNGNSLNVCVNGAWVERACANGCENGACIGEEPKCENGAKECVDGNTARVCVAGDWNVTACTNGCENGACVTAPVDACTTGSKKCDDKTVMNCVDGKWVAGDVCDDICLNGACANARDLPKEGDACDENFKEICAGNTGYYCSQGQVALLDCAGHDLDCVVRAADDYADCSEACKAGDPAIGECVSYMGYPLAVTYNCEATTDGGYAYFQGDYEFCEVSCSEGKCSDDPQPPVDVTYELCSDDCSLQDGRTCAEACKEESATSTCVLDSDNYIECSEACSKAGDTTPVCITSQGTGYLLNQVCTDVDGKLLYITDYSDYSACANGCNPAGTACEGGSVPSTCTEGAVQCSGKTVQTCTNGAWVDSKTCDVACKDGKCSDPSVVPTVGDNCDDSLVEICDGNTGYYCNEGTVATIECDSDAPCAVRAADNYSDCAETCKAGDQPKGECVSYMGYPLAVAYNCEKTEDGGYAYFMGDYQFCESSCSAGICDGQAPATCTEGAKQCSGKTVQVCTNGAWVDGNTCDEKCSNGECVAAGNVPTVGDVCDENFTEMCDGDTGYYCSGGQVAALDCGGNGYVCAARASDGYVDCVNTCKAGDQPMGVCRNYMGYPMAVQYTCEKTSDGSYAYFISDDYELCSVTCVEGVCSDKVVYNLCPDSCQIEGGQSCADACKAESATSTCVLDSDNYIECSEACSKAGNTSPVCITSQGTGYLLNQVCTDVDGKLLYITDYSDYSACANGCNAAGTACK